MIIDFNSDAAVFLASAKKNIQNKRYLAALDLVARAIERSDMNAAQQLEAAAILSHLRCFRESNSLLFRLLCLGHDNMNIYSLLSFNFSRLNCKDISDFYSEKGIDSYIAELKASDVNDIELESALQIESELKEYRDIELRKKRMSIVTYDENDYQVTPGDSNEKNLLQTEDKEQILALFLLFSRGKNSNETFDKGCQILEKRPYLVQLPEVFEVVVISYSKCDKTEERTKKLYDLISSTIFWDVDSLITYYNSLFNLKRDDRIFFSKAFEKNFPYYYNIEGEGKNRFGYTAAFQWFRIMFYHNIGDTGIAKDELQSLLNHFPYRYKQSLFGHKIPSRQRMLIVPGSHTYPKNYIKFFTNMVIECMPSFTENFNNNIVFRDALFEIFRIVNAENLNEFSLLIVAIITIFNNECPKEGCIFFKSVLQLGVYSKIAVDLLKFVLIYSPVITNIRFISDDLMHKVTIRRPNNFDQYDSNYQEVFLILVACMAINDVDITDKAVDYYNAHEGEAFLQEGLDKKSQARILANILYDDEPIKKASIINKAFINIS